VTIVVDTKILSFGKWEETKITKEQINHGDILTMINLLLFFE